MSTAVRALTDEEVQLLLKQGFHGRNRLRDRSLFALGISTGYRINEIVHQKVEDIAYRRTVRQVLQLPSRLRKGRGGGQVKKLMPFAREVLQQYLDVRLYGRNDFTAYGKEWLFPSIQFEKGQYGEKESLPRDERSRKPIETQQAYRTLKKAFDRCGIRDAVATHSMRKTFALKLYSQATKEFREGKLTVEPLRIVQLHLGHRNISSTLHYMNSVISLDVDDSYFNYEV